MSDKIRELAKEICNTRPVYYDDAERIIRRKLKPLRVVDYIVEEVERQGHDTAKLDGIERVGWMLAAWAKAMHPEWVLGRDQIEQLGQIVERWKNRNGFRTCAVRVGNRVCPPPENVKPQLEMLLREHKRNPLTPLNFYREFELIHPFVDGNGRTGKILLNWLNGTMLSPIFPPVDLFGYPITNP